jgi:hypothetical protein
MNLGVIANRAKPAQLAIDAPVEIASLRRSSQ